MSKGLTIVKGAATEQQLPGLGSGKATIGIGENNEIIVTINDGADAREARTIQAEIRETQADDYQVAEGDGGKILDMTKATANTVTLPDDTEDSDIAIGFRGTVRQMGAGLVSFASSGTINSLGSATDSAGQYSVIHFEKIAADTWLIWGDIA